MKQTLLLMMICIGLVVSPGPVIAEGATIKTATITADPNIQTPQLFQNEARAVYLGNMERRKAGLPPLRWNRELTLAARWFGWDSIVNRPAGWIGHDDTLAGLPANRAAKWGYRGSAGAENVGRATYVLSSADAIGMWMNSAGHRQNMLAAGHSEIGFGYYSNGKDTYTVQDFGADAASAPLIIQNEKPETTSPTVSLYQHSPKAASITDIGPAARMMVSSSACFTGAAWQAYQPESSFTLPAGTGWKRVYSKIRDRLGRTAVSSDVIYLGGTAPAESYNLNQLSTRSPAVTLYGLDGVGLTYAQFSLGWTADNSSPAFKKWWGAGGHVNDSAAIGGTAFRMTPADGETMAWVTSNGFLNTSARYVAYFRVKTSSRSSSGEVARIAVEANGKTTQISLRGTNFTAANTYQEFAVAFNYDRAAADRWLKFITWRSGSADITFDAVTIFTAPRTFTPTYQWTVPGGNYRGQGVWVRYSTGTGNGFTTYREARTCR